MNNYAYYLSLLNLKLELAEKMSGTVIQNNPDNATYLDTYAWVLFKKKDYRLAKFYIESAINNDKESSAVLIEHYGDILYLNSGDWVESLSALTEDYDGNWEVEYYVPEPQANNSVFEDKKDIRFAI